MANAILLLSAVYLGVGVVFAALFLTCGIHRIDPATGSAPWSFRLIILPGVILLWPRLAWQWRRAVTSEAQS